MRGSRHSGLFLRRGPSTSSRFRVTPAERRHGGARLSPGNTGDEPLTFLEMFRSDRYADLSLRQWMALTPYALVQAHTRLDRAAIDGLPAAKGLIVPG